MGYKFLLFSLFLLTFSCKSNEKSTLIENNSTEIDSSLFVWHWEDEFSIPEKQKIQKYITTVSEASFKVLGNYPFKIHFYIERSNEDYEAIPWAHTERSEEEQAVRFYVNPDFDYESFYEDWTAPHEISHLAIPYLGSENAWFAEGFASYMQYQIMQEMGVYSEEEVQKKYQDKKSLIENAYNDDLPFVKDTKQLKARYNYPAMYWGGAQYFIKINELLLEQETTLIDEIKIYQTCCRLKDNDISSLLKSLDNNLKIPVFERLYEECKKQSFEEVFD